MHYFKEQTMSSTIVMGRGTYETFLKPLPGRRNIVVSKNLNSVTNGFELIDDLPSFLSEAAVDIWIIGGAKLYTSALQYCEELYITHINGSYGCDRFFPSYADNFELFKTSRPQVDNGYEFRYAVYVKNR